MRKISSFLSVFLTVAIMLSFCGCGNGVDSENNTALERSAVEAQAESSPGKNGFAGDKSAADGLGAAADGPGVAADGLGVASSGSGVAADGLGVASDSPGAASDGPNVAPSGQSVTADDKNDESQLLHLTIFSKALNQDMDLNIYLPAGYSSQEKYPVLYMIHGYSGDQNVWMPDMMLGNIADALIAAGKIHPLIIVTPNIDNSYGINSAKITRQLGSNPTNSLDEGMYADYIINDVISYVDSNYSTINSKEGRYIGGLSMGGYAALHLAFVYEDKFSKVGGHSPALFLGDFEDGLRGWLYPDESSRKARDPIQIAQDKDLTSLEVYLDCGKKDSYKFYEGCEELQGILQDKGVKSEYHLNSGEHDGQYWMENSADYLLFYAGK